MPALSQPLLTLAMPDLIVIPNWDRDFESAKSRTIAKTTFFCVPNHFDGKKIRRLMSLGKKSAEFYGVFHGLCAVASRCWWRGVLLDHDGPISVEDLVQKIGFNANVIENAVKNLAKPGVALIQVLPIEYLNGRWQLPESVLGWAVPQDARRDPTRTRESARGPTSPHEDPRGPTDPVEEKLPVTGHEDPRGPTSPHEDPRGPTDPSRVEEGIGEKRRGGETPSLSLGAEVKFNPILFEEAKKLLALLFKRPLQEHWSCEELELLSRLCPMERGLWPLVSTWFALPDDHPVFEKTMRRQSLPQFLRESGAEVDKMRKFSAMFMPNGAVPQKKEPPEWREFMKWQHSNDEIKLPSSFWLMAADERALYERYFETYQAREKKEAAK